MGPYDPAEPQSQIIKQLEKGIESVSSAVHTIYDAIMMSKENTLLVQMGILNDDIIEWRRKSADLKMWEKYKLFFPKRTENKQEQ